MSQKQLSRTLTTITSRFALTSTVALLAGCADHAVTGEDALVTVDQALIGGAPAAADYFRSTVGIGDECTAAKVGRRLFLTAAHCVAVPRLYRTTPPPGYPANGGVDDPYVAGQPVLIQWGLDASGPSGTFTIVQTSIHPSWWVNPGAYDPLRGSDGAADIAVVEIAEDTPDIPEARVELDTVAPGTRVVQVGRGCEVSTRTPDDHLGRFKAQEETTLPPDPQLAIVAPPLSEEESTNIKNSYLFTPGKTQDPNASSLCLGDSGGPLYLRDNSDPRVVGVNSDYKFTDDSGVSWNDWHTQTALGSIHGVGAWLKGLGVNTVGTPWNLDRIDQRAPTPADGYHYTGNGTGVHVYVLDSGIRATHEQFQGRIGEGWDFVDDDADTDDVGPIGHGTGVASIIGGKDLGVARNVTLHAVRVLDQMMYGNEADAIAGIQWVIDHHVSPAVINMSFTTPIYNDEMAQAVARAINAGITVVVSAGNNGEDACNYYPAGFPGVITVGASDRFDNRWVGDLGRASNTGSCVELFAPGVDVETAGNWEDSATTTSTGTTEAAPHVAGAAAIYLGAHPSATPAEVAQAIISQATQGALSNVGAGSPNSLLYTPDLAGSPSCTETVVEAETMTASTGGPVTGGWNIWSNGNISFNHRFPQGSSQLTVTARGEQGGGVWPNMTVTINGSQVYSTTVSSASWTDYTFNVSSVTGDAQVRINFTNDYYANGQDRNLIVDKVTVKSCSGTGGNDCTIATAVDLGLDGHSVTVPTDGCVKVASSYPSWWGTRNMTLQSNSGTAYPIPLEWSNACTSSSGSGTLAADWQGLVIGPVSAQCATLIDLRGTAGGQVTLRYFGN